MHSGKLTFLVTGASKGIGRAVSEILAARGHQVVGLARNAEAVNFPVRSWLAISPSSTRPKECWLASPPVFRSTGS